MSMPLAEALEQVELAPGSTYCCQVKGQWVEVRVLNEQPTLLAKQFIESDIMVDAWIELPGVNVVRRCRARAGVQLPFDVPNVPTERAGA